MQCPISVAPGQYYAQSLWLLVNTMPNLSGSWSILRPISVAPGQNCTQSYWLLVNTVPSIIGSWSVLCLVLVNTVPNPTGSLSVLCPVLLAPCQYCAQSCLWFCDLPWWPSHKEWSMSTVWTLLTNSVHLLQSGGVLNDVRQVVGWGAGASFVKDSWRWGAAHGSECGLSADHGLVWVWPARSHQCSWCQQSGVWNLGRSKNCVYTCYVMWNALTSTHTYA